MNFLSGLFIILASDETGAEVWISQKEFAECFVKWSGERIFEQNASSDIEKSPDKTKILQFDFIHLLESYLEVRSESQKISKTNLREQVTFVIILHS